jgi:hypothetical protein
VQIGGALVDGELQQVVDVHRGKLSQIEN